ncbi:MAG: chromosomal replication initiator protein DnaA [Myxococcota bacterium]
MPPSTNDESARSAVTGGDSATLRGVWDGVQDALRDRIRREQFDTWFRCTELRALERTSQGQHRVELAVHNEFSREFIRDSYLEPLAESFECVLGNRPSIDFCIDQELVPRSPRQDKDQPDDPQTQGSRAESDPGTLQPHPPRQTGSPTTPAIDHRSRQRTSIGDALDLPANGQEPKRSLRSRGPRTNTGLLIQSDVGLNSKYRFETYVVGPCNRFAHAAAVGVAESPGTNYNPYFIHGNVGLGKTHLMQSMCHALLDRDPDVRILYLSCETFLNHFISALDGGDLQEFRNKYRNVDVLVVDDIHLLANKERNQEEFFHTFNTLYNAGKQIVLSSDSPPVDIPSLQERLVSRFKWGLVTEIAPPCVETRAAILKRKARERGSELPDELATLIAERITTNIRELEGAVTRLIGYAAVTGQKLSTDLAREALADLFKTQVGHPTMEDVLSVVTEYFGIKVAELQSRRRTASIAYARQMGMFLARRSTRHSLEEIGGFFGGRDHSTVLYAVQKIETAISKDSAAFDTVQDLLGRLGNARARA